jgi:sugar (pentulose or hexulose) kinase
MLWKVVSVIPDGPFNGFEINSVSSPMRQSPRRWRERQTIMMVFISYPPFLGCLHLIGDSMPVHVLSARTVTHRKGHVCRAALEAAAYQTREVFDAIYADSHVLLLRNLRVDGGGTNNKLLMQFQSDMINVPVVKPKVMETIAMGAAFCGRIGCRSLEERRADSRFVECGRYASTSHYGKGANQKLKNWTDGQRP